MNNPDEMLETLARSDMFRKYERAFSDATGLPLTLRPVETWRLPLHGKRRENPFCALMAESGPTCAACLRAQEELARDAKDVPGAMTCAYGLREIAAPVKLGDRTIGLLQSGQVMRRKPTAASYRRAVEQAGRLGVDIDSRTARDAYFRTPVISESKLESLSDLLAIFADHLSLAGNQIALRTANAEPPMIGRARQYIREHHTEELTLGGVAAAMHTSVFYFCKLFHKSTGTTFTEFVSRVRVERAKEMLLNPNLRVSKVAFEVGFQSLTHFNRVFKTVTGMSPSGFRRKLPQIGGAPQGPRGTA